MSIAFKLTNLAIAISLLSVLAIKVAKAREALGVAPLTLAFVALVAPLVPFSLFMYKEAASPIFPYYNNIFRSPYFSKPCIIGTSCTALGG